MTPVRWLLAIAGTIGVVAFINNADHTPEMATTAPIESTKPIHTERDFIAERAFDEMRLCFQSAYTIMLRGGLNDREQIVSQGIDLCKAQIALLASRMHGSRDEISSLLLAIAHQELALAAPP